MIQKATVSFILVLMMLCNALKAQPVETIVPKEPVVVGTAFQVQYIVHNADELQKITPPQFTGFTLIAGPRTYKGFEIVNGVKKEVHNIVYTLIADHTGILNVQGATAVFKSSQVNSRSAKVVVIATPLVENALKNSFIKEFERDLKENIFIKVEADKKECYVGEPVTATFTLYASVPSTSEVIKNPGFYGFSVVDMLKLSERKTVLKNVAGKMYETAILRKVQLYPLQSGDLQIEEMEVHNDVEVVDPNTQAINSISYNTASKAFVVKVNELPQQKQPQNFNGAVGQFAVKAHLLKNSFAKNEQGRLVVVISGKGNFLQLGEPEINWPKGIDVFEPQVKQQVQQDKAPLLGVKVLEYPIIANDTGVKTIPSIAFSYFNPATESYQTDFTEAISFTVSPATKKEENEAEDKGGSNYAPWLIFIPLALIALLLFFYKKKKKEVLPQKNDAKTLQPTYEQRIREIAASENSKAHYIELQKVLNDFIRERFQPSAATLSQTIILNELRNNSVGEDVVLEWKTLLQEIETVVYTNAPPSYSFDTLKGKAIRLVK